MARLSISVTFPRGENKMWMDLRPQISFPLRTIGSGLTKLKIPRSSTKTYWISWGGYVVKLHTAQKAGKTYRCLTVVHDGSCLLQPQHLIGCTKNLSSRSKYTKEMDG